MSRHLQPWGHDDRSQSSRSFRSGAPHPTFNPRETSLMCGVAPQMVSRVDIRDVEEKELSVRSFNTTKTTSRVSYRPVLEHPLEPEEQAEEARSYEAIERILKSENQNLRSQNELLLKEVHRLKKSNYAHREEYKQLRVEVEQAREECEAQKRRADEMKEIIMSRLAHLEARLAQDAPANNSHFAIEECESILEALTFSESEIK